MESTAGTRTAGSNAKRAQARDTLAYTARSGRLAVLSEALEHRPIRSSARPVVGRSHPRESRRATATHRRLLCSLARVVRGLTDEAARAAAGAPVRVESGRWPAFCVQSDQRRVGW